MTTQPQSCVLDIHLKADLANTSKYGRMFPTLPALQVKELDLLALGRVGAAIDVATDSPVMDNPRIPAGFTMFGHFIAHDLTADRSLLRHHANLREVRNFREPHLDLEALYGSGPTGAPYLYDANDSDKFLLGLNDAGKNDDVPRNRQGRALLGDARNDVHAILAQFHLLLLKFHNAAVDAVRADGAAASDVFSQAQRNVRWHVQWLALHEYLPLIVGAELATEACSEGPRYLKFRSHPFIPLEFSDAAYRFGHSQIRSVYRLNDSTTETIIPGLQGGRAIASSTVVDWRYFFQLDDSVRPQASRRIGPAIAHALIDLPESMVGVTEVPEYHSLACRDLIRGRALNLPSGEEIARFLNVAVLSQEQVGLHRFGWRNETPLWYYILKEAEVLAKGEHLGPVGGRIVADVLVGLIDNDPLSYRKADPNWKPAFARSESAEFTVEDLVRYTLGGGVRNFA